MMPCPICGSPESNPHFGGISCRPCAAFFRRYCLSKKTIRRCTCATRLAKSHPCRECRMKKCLAIGMRESNIQLGHEKLGNQRTKSNSLMTVNLVNPCRIIIPRESAHISSSKASSSLPSYEKKRMELFGGDRSKWNVYDLTGCVKKDSKTIWNIVSNLFPQVLDLKYYDKDSLISNFVPKWCQLEPTIDQTRNRTKLKLKFQNTDKKIGDDLVIRFYKLTDEKLCSRSDIIKKLGRLWTYYVDNVVMPIVCKQFDDKEFLAIVLLLFFDNGYTNITEKCAEMCRDIRKVILRELRAYQRDITDNDDDADKRFLSIMDVPSMFEKGERKFEEEMLVCEMHHVRIHEDFLEAIRRHNL